MRLCDVIESPKYLEKKLWSKNRIARCITTDVITSIQCLYIFYITRQIRCHLAGKNVRRINSIIINCVLFHQSFIQFRSGVVLLLLYGGRIHSYIHSVYDRVRALYTTTIHGLASGSKRVVPQPPLECGYGETRQNWSRSSILVLFLCE